MLRCLLLDRDGTLLTGCGSNRYQYGEHEFSFLPFATEVLAEFQRVGVACAVCTNQQGVSLAEFPLMTMESVVRFNQRVNESLGSRGCSALPFFVCPHSRDDGCKCRKPAPGLLTAALLAFDVHPVEAWFVGDKVSDYYAAAAAGVLPVLLDVGDSRDWSPGSVIVPNWNSLRTVWRCGFHRVGVLQHSSFGGSASTVQAERSQSVEGDGDLRRVGKGEPAFVPVPEEVLIRVRKFLHGSKAAAVVLDLGFSLLPLAQSVLQVGGGYVCVADKGILRQSTFQLIVDAGIGSWGIAQFMDGEVGFGKGVADVCVCRLSGECCDSVVLDLLKLKVETLIDDGMLYVQYRTNLHTETRKQLGVEPSESVDWCDLQPCRRVLNCLVQVGLRLVYWQKCSLGLCALPYANAHSESVSFHLLATRVPTSDSAV